ncbi:hypothetical protein GW17_00040538 [Ensete ventricosum]|nr:hypothetical protein GW17_00040538 [Ensete ventricosum]
MHYIVGRLGLFLHSFIFEFEVFFRWYGVLILYCSMARSCPFLQRCSRLHGSSQCQHNPLVDRLRSSSLVNFFGARARMAVEGAEGFGMAGRGATLVLRTSWFNRSSWILAKEIAAIRVYGCRAFTSPRISGFRSVMLRSFFYCGVSGIRIFGEEVAGWMVVGGTYEERDSEQDKREVGYSPRAKDTQYEVPTGKRSHKESLQWRKPASMFLKRAWRNSTKANEGSFGIESSQEEAESRIDKVES